MRFLFGSVLELQRTRVHLFLLVAIICCGTQGINAQVTIITQPDNITACVGRTAVFTCVIDINNAHDIGWWRIRKDHKNDSTTLLIIPNNTPIFKIKNSVIGDNFRSDLMIFNLKSTHMGPYFLEFMDTNDNTIRSTMGFLNIVPDQYVSTAPINIGFPTDKVKNVSFVVRWDAVINQSVDGYMVNWTDGINHMQSVIVKEILCTVIGLTPNTTYTVTVAAVNICGTGPASAGNNSVTTNMSLLHGVTPTATINNIITTDSVTYPTATLNTTNPATTSASGGSSAGAIAGGVIGGIVVVIIIVIIIIILYKLCVNKRDDAEHKYYEVCARGRNGNNNPAVSNSLTYSEVHKKEAETVPHQTTDTGVLYAVSTKAVSEDTDNEALPIYTYVKVDAQRKIAGMPIPHHTAADNAIPHQTAADGVQYAVSTKVTSKDDHVTDNDVVGNDVVDKRKEDHEIKYADLQSLPTTSNMCTVKNENSPQYVQLVT